MLFFKFEIKALREYFQPEAIKLTEHFTEEEIEAIQNASGLLRHNPEFYLGQSV